MSAGLASNRRDPAVQNVRTRKQSRGEKKVAEKN